jgi:hypothetical protein
MENPLLTSEILAAAIGGFEAQKVRIDEQIAQLRQLLNGDRPVAASTSEPQKQPRRKMSAATRKRMAEAQRKRWAAKSGAEEASETTAKPKRKLSAAGRAAIVAALKKRWAAKKAGLTVVKKGVAKNAVAKKAAPRKAVGKKAPASASAAA